MYFNVNFNVFFKLIIVRLLMSELYVSATETCRLNDVTINICNLSPEQIPSS